MNVIDVRGLTKRFADRTVVHGIDLQVREREIVGFLGPNGSGKTTTIRMLCGLLRPDAAEGSCLGFDVKRDAAAIKRQTGYMTQRFSLYEDLTVEENLDFVARLYDLRPRAARVAQTLAQSGLSARRHQLAASLSGGWKQRLALAACVMHEPKLLLLDEPTAGVDPQARREFWDEIHRLADAGVTVLVSTHYMDEAERCHRIVYIMDGVILADGTIPELIAGAGLHTVTVRGPGVVALRPTLESLDGVDEVTPFGEALHLTGTDHAALMAAITPYRDNPALSWTEDETSLEDLFIHLLRSRRTGERP
ncbi:MAG: ABC transporter ATP-binding protein [Pseudomonadales bacterium]|jgi:ABC-2 type transport system ATP-binding protein|nr:ABC transporter ATP-binding protein [Pseudomonadales bacterium]MCP5321685.1 ABC transporter ATP-binding protein [Pseudomonadales bacterium]